MHAAAISSFFLIVQDTFLNHFKRADEERLSPELVQLWNDVVEKELWTCLFSHWRSLLPMMQPESTHESTGASHCFLMTHFKQPLNAPILVRRFSEAIAAGLSLRATAPIKENIALAETCSSLLLSSFLSLQLLSYRVLIRYICLFLPLIFLELVY